MNLSGLFIIRPVMTTLIMVAFFAFGIISYFMLPINDLPAVDFPTIMVHAQLPGANPDTVASTVATPLERQFALISGVESMNSTSSTGSCQIVLQFAIERPMDAAAQDVQAAIIAARPFLPSSMPLPPIYKKVNPSDAPILFIALSSPTLPLYIVDEYAENQLAPRISMVSGVAQVQVYGSQIYAPHVQVDPRKLSAYGIGIDEVAAAIRAANVNLPTGTLHGPTRTYNIMANGQLFNADAFKPVIVGYRNGHPVRLSDIGTVTDGVQTDKVASWYNNTRAVILAIQRQPNTNTIQIVDNVKKLLPSFEASLPGDVHINILYDRSQSIRRSVDDVKRTLLITVVLVILVIFAFLGNPSTTIIASLSLPISIIGTFAAMKLFGFTINNITLMALTLCVGFVVDDSIVVMENIVRHMERGESAFDAAMRGSKEIYFTIVSMTVSLIAVFIPILMMGGLIGRLFFEFAVTMSVAILISGIVSLTLTPMLCSRFLKIGTIGTKSNMQLIAEGFFAKLLAVYDRTLRGALNHKLLVIFSFVLMLVGTGILLWQMPKGFLPNEDTGQVMGTTEGAQGISFDAMMKKQKQVVDIVAKDPAVDCFMSSVAGGGGPSSVNQGRVFVVLKPASERGPLDPIVERLKKSTTGIPGIRMYMQSGPSMHFGGGHGARSLYQLTLSGPSKTELYAAADTLMKKMKAMPGIKDINDDMQNRNLQLEVTVDRERLSRMGLTMQQVQDALNSAYAQRQVSVIYTPTNQYWVVLETEREFNKDQSMMSWLRVRSKTGALIPLGSIAKITRSVGPQQVNHLGQFPSVTISFNIAPGTSLSDAVGKIRDLAPTILPPSVSFNFQGAAKQFESSMQNLGILLVVSVLIIYIVLGCLYESFVHPITILSGLPSAGLGALLFLMLFRIPLDIYGFLGLILLIGIVKKNAIMMIDFAVEAQRNEGLKTEDAIYKACLVRFRPIMMTTMAALLGSLPIAIGYGPGSESRQPLGLTIVGGLLVSQLVTLYITPVFYIYLDRLQKFMARRREKKHAWREGVA